MTYTCRVVEPLTSTVVFSAAGAAIVALWRRIVVLEDRNYQDQQAAINALRDHAETLRRLTELIEDLRQDIKEAG